MNAAIREVITKMKRPCALAVAFEFYKLERIANLEERMRQWAREGTHAAANAPRIKNLFAQIAALFPDNAPELRGERLRRAARLLEEIAEPVPSRPRVTTKPLAPETNVQYLKGVGPARARAFANLGVTTVRDLLYLFPRKYVDRTAATPIAHAREGEEITVAGRVIDITSDRTRRGVPLVTALLQDATGDIFLRWFNAPYVAQKIKTGDELMAAGTVRYFGGPSLVNPEYELLGDGADEVAFGKIIPVYPLAAGLNQKVVRRAAAAAVNAVARALPDPLPPWVLARTGFPPLAEALSQIHFPDEIPVQQIARRRLSFEYLYLLEVALLQKRRQGLTEKGVVIKGDGSWRQKVKLPFELTAAQKKALAAIETDLAAPWPMRRLLQGDVGAGKTVVALFAMLATAEAGYQAALMAPTEILAQQHWRTAYGLLRPAGLTCELLSGTTGAADRDRILRGLAAGTISLIIGTHALIEDDVVFKNLGLAVVDEQHRFGVNQRQRLVAKGVSPNLLVMTATPIPRTLALCVYGDLELTIINEMPRGRGSITTLLIPERERHRALEIIRREVTAGRQSFIVYPVIEDTAGKELKAATAMARELQHKVFTNHCVRLVHGRMDANEREAVMAAFRAGEVDILVATTVVEVGLDVPNATVMMVEHADRYGLSQLHQLRGRVGRGPHPSYFIMVAPEETTAEARQRLKTLEMTNDGFEIAEADLRLRGPGELLGTRQHGLPDFALQALVHDRDLFETARALAEETLNAAPDLAGAEYEALRRRLQDEFAARLHLAGAA